MSTFVRYNSDDLVLSSDKVFTNTWSDDANALTSSFFVASQSFTPVPADDQRAFRVEVYKDNISSQTNPSASVQFSVSYGHKQGSGSLLFNGGTGAEGLSASRVIYNQYRQLVYGDETQFFTFGGTTFNPNDVIVINIDRARYKQRLKPTSLFLKLTSGSKSTSLIAVDNNGALNNDTPVTTLTEAGRQFNLVSGSATAISGSNIVQTNSGSYGYFYPDAGFIVLNVDALRANPFNVNYFNQPSNATGSLQNAYNLISASGNFILDSEETITSRYLYTRIKNSDFNYTTNPSYLDTSGSVRFPSFGQNPATYLTTIGLYNDNNDLVAVAKASQPLKKTFTKEYLLTVKLDF
jgi:hypothetical protein